jgi:addiction module HigA family antidote
MNDTPTLKPIPTLNSDEEAERFVENADLTDYDLSGFHPVRFKLDTKSVRIDMQLPESLLVAIKVKSRARGIPYQRFIREAVEKAVDQEVLPAVHPGAFLDELLHEFAISQAEFAQAVEIPPDRLSAVIHGEQPVTADLALLFAEAFDQSPHYWLNLQAEYDLATASINIGAQLKRVHRVCQR